MDKPDLLGKKVRWRVATANGLLPCEATVTNVRSFKEGFLAEMDNGSVANVECLSLAAEKEPNEINNN